MKRRSFAAPLRNESGQGLIMVLIASICLLISFLALASSLSYVANLNSAAQRRTTAEDYVRNQLQAMKGVVGQAGGVAAFARSLEPPNNVFNPILTADLSNPATFQTAFGFAPTTTVTIGTVVYTATFSASSYSFNAAFAVVPFKLNVYRLSQLAYIQFTVDLIPTGTDNGNGLGGQMSRHGEIYVAQ